MDGGVRIGVPWRCRVGFRAGGDHLEGLIPGLFCISGPDGMRGECLAGAGVPVRGIKWLAGRSHFREEFVMQRRSLSPATTAKPVKERTLPIDKDVFAERLWSAIKRSGLTYKETARRAQEHLPPGARISDVSVWSYAKGRSLPRRMTHVEALSKVLGIDTDELLTTQAHSHSHSHVPRGAEAGNDTQEVQIEDLGDGRAFLRIAQPLPWQVAVEILRLVKASPDDAEPRAGAQDGQISGIDGEAFLDDALPASREEE